MFSPNTFVYNGQCYYVPPLQSPSAAGNPMMMQQQMHAGPSVSDPHNIIERQSKEIASLVEEKDETEKQGASLEQPNHQAVLTLMAVSSTDDAGMAVRCALPLLPMPCSARPAPMCHPCPPCLFGQRPRQVLDLAEAWPCRRVACHMVGKPRCMHIRDPPAFTLSPSPSATHALTPPSPPALSASPYDIR